MAGEGVVARIVGRNSHDRPRAVASQHVVRNVDRNRLARERVDRIGACRYTAYALGFGDALPLGAFLRLGDVLLDGGPLFGRGKVVNPFVLRSDDHEGNAEDRVGTRGEYLEFSVGALDVEEDLGAFRTADPVALDLLQRVAPLEPLQSVEHPLGVGRYAEQPLFHPLLFDGKAAAFGESVLHLVVGQYRAQLRTPIDHRVGAERQAVVLEDLFAFLFGFGFPFVGRETHLLRAGGVESFGALRLETGDEFFDRFGLVRTAVVVVFEHLQKGPLGPFVIGGIAGADLTVPVEREADLVELFPVAGDVPFGRYGGVLPRLNGVLFGRQAESVVAHRMKYVEAAKPFVARVDVRSDIAQRVSDVQTRTRRVGEHVEHVEFGPRRVGLDLVGFIFLPAALPLGLDLLEIVLHSSS